MELPATIEYETLTRGCKALFASCVLRNQLYDLIPYNGSLIDTLDEVRSHLAINIPLGDMAMSFALDDTMRGIKHAAMIGMGTRTGMLSGWHYSPFLGKHVG